MRENTLLLLLSKQLIVYRMVLSSLNKNHFTSSVISPYFNAPPLHKIIIRVKIIVCSETLFSKNPYHIETSQFSPNLTLEVQNVWKFQGFNATDKSIDMLRNK